MSLSLADKIEAIIAKELDNTLIPVKTKTGIKLGRAEIISEGTTKHVKIRNRMKFRGVFLNITAIALADMLANKKQLHELEKIYEADQAYGRYYIDSQLLRYNYNKAVQDRDEFKINMFWARYTDRRDKVLLAKRQLEQLIRS